MALQLNHVHLKTHDPEKTAQFYVETLGAKIVGKAGTNGYRLDLHGLSLNVTTFLESQTREQKYGMEHIAIDTDELDHLVEKLKAKASISWSKPPFPVAGACVSSRDRMACNSNLSRCSLSAARRRLLGTCG
jgi:catechol-2,3-dioxygenase